MTTKAAGLSARRVQTVKKSGHHADGGGLYLQVAATGARTWIFRFQLRGRRRDMGLGSAAVFSLADARQKAVAARRLVAEGVDPIEDRKAREAARRAEEEAAEKATITFRHYATGYVDAHKSEWRNAKHADQWISTLETYAFPVIGDHAVAMIDTALVRKVLDPIWSTKKETARRVRGRIEAILDSAKAEGVRVGDNPAAWAGNLKLVLPSKGIVSRDVV